MKSLSELPLRNEKTGVTEVYEIQDAEARQQLEGKASKEDMDSFAKSVSGHVEKMAEQVTKKAEQMDLDRVSKKVDAIASKSTYVSGTKLVIEV